LSGLSRVRISPLKAQDLTLPVSRQQTVEPARNSGSAPSRRRYG
jgi:hypothetical protein